MARSVEVAELVGKTLVSIDGMAAESGRVVLVAADGAQYRMMHDQDCCETVAIVSVDGDVSDLLGTPIQMAEESTNRDDLQPNAESGTWTFYKFATAKGYVTVRWLGESNGYYGEEVSFYDVTPGARECTDCGGSGYGPDRCDGPGDVSQDRCGHCGGRGLEPEVSHA